MLFHTTKWGWKRIAVGLLLAPVTFTGWPGVATAATPPARPLAMTPATDPKAMLKEAKAALEAGDLNRAQDLAQQAEASNPTGKWGLFDDTPASLRKKIAAARQVADKQEIARLVSEARTLLNRPAQTDAEKASNLDYAMKLARKADALHGPEYSVWETGDRPDKVIRDIDAVLSKLPPQTRLPAPPTQASTLAAQEAQKPKPPRLLPPPPMGTGAVASAPRTPAVPGLVAPVASPQVAPIQTTAGTATPNAVVTATATKPTPDLFVEPGGSKGGPVAPAAPGMIVPPTPPVALSPTQTPPEVKRVAAEKLIAESKALATKGEFVAARAKLLEADALQAPFAPNEGPGFALQELNGLAVEVKDKLVREVRDSIAKKDFTRAEAALRGADQIAMGLKLSAADVEEARKLLQHAMSPAMTTPPVATATSSAPAALPMVVMAPPARPTESPAPVAEGPGPLTGKQLLEQAAIELKQGDLGMATSMARQAYNRGDVKAEAQAMLTQIDAQAFNRRKVEAEKSFDNAVRGFAARDYSMTLGVLALIDPKLLPAEKAAKREELMTACQAAVDGTQKPVQPAAGQLPANPSLAGGPGALPANGGTSPNDPPLMKVDTQPSSPNAGFAKPSEPGESAKQAQAMREIQFQKLRTEGLNAMTEAQAAFSRGETDIAINLLNDYSNTVRASTLDNTRIALLMRPIDARLSQFRVMKGHVDALTREKKEKNDAKELLNGRAAAEQQRQAEIHRLQREYYVQVKEKRDFAAAEVLALQMKQLNPDDPAIQALVAMAQMQRRVNDYEKIKIAKEEIVRVGLNEAEKPGPIVTIDNPVALAPVTRQLDGYMRGGRRNMDEGYQRNRSQAEFEIEMKLERPVRLAFNQTPLSLAVQNITESAQIPVFFDKTAINAESPGSLEQPVDADFNVSAKNALALILESAGLSYVIEKDVVQITTIKKSKGRLFTKVFSVADLVTPVPNFALPDYANLSKILGKSAIDSPQALINGNTVRNAVMGGGQPAGTTGVKWDGANGTGGSNKLESVPSGGDPSKISTTNNGFGTQFTGTMTKHEQLIKLVCGMVRPLTWDAAGGNGRIEFYDIGSALVVNQTGDVIREVADLLEALRRLQDLAVAIEMRIVSLSETFFERMGVDFAVNVETHNTRFEPNLTSGVFRPDPFINSMNGYNATVGLTPAGTFTPDLNVPIRATSFDYAIPGFGNFPNNPGYNGGVSLGLAFLNDIQVYMFMEAAQGDRRQNIMQAPKITLFNGQTATISITDFAYFVTNVQVFSVNGQIVFVPQNTPLPIGTQGSLGGQIGVQAVVSADRRFVRITPTLSLQTISGALTPLFPVTTFITPVFEGGSQGQPIPFTQFLQQPSLATIDVQTTVVCPDGGTVLMGGFKYLAEGRNEFGPPFLSKIPYLNRLFKNVGIGRETRHLMLMITPRIIITAEEELIQTEGVRFPGQGPTP